MIGIKHTVKKSVLSYFTRAELEQSDVLSYVAVDMDESARFTKGILALTEDALYLISEDRAASVRRFSLADYDALCVDEMLSTCRFYALKGEERELITYATFFAKEDLFRLIGDLTS